MDSDISPASEAPRAGPDGSCPSVMLLSLECWCPFLPHQACSVPFGFPSTPSPNPPVSVPFPLGFYEICHDISSGWSEY